MKQSPNDISADEIAVTSGMKILDPSALLEFLQKLKSTTTTIQKAFERQVKTAAICHLFL